MNEFNVDRKEETLDIPDFVEDKSETTSVDMSIFKMSDEELYDDVPVKHAQNDKGDSKPTKKSNSGVIILSILAILLAIATAATLIYAVSQKKEVETVNTALNQAQAKIKELETKNSELANSVESLNAQIEELKHPKVTDLYYEITDGPVTYRDAPNRDADSTEYEGYDYAANGEKFKVIEVVEDEKDSDYTWAKIAEGVYFCLGTEDDVWASKVE